MSDIQENIKEIEMDDHDNTRLRKIREYSFSPSKTPSKRGRDDLHERKLNHRDVNEGEQRKPSAHFNNQRTEEKPARYYKASDFVYKFNRNQKVLTPAKFEVSELRMIDQPNYDGIDKNVILW